MSKHSDILQIITDLDAAETPFAIASVFKVQGSSSGKVGDKALFDENGKNNVIETFRSYIEDEFAAMDMAYSQVFEGKLSKNDQILDYHYDREKNERDSEGKPTGNAFKHTLFPELSFGESYSEGFYTQDGKPIYSSRLIAENEGITNLIKTQFEKYVTSQIDYEVECYRDAQLI